MKQEKHLKIQHFYRPTWVEIDKQAFRNNILNIKSQLKHNTKIMAIVKANAYGHGAVELAKIALQNGASCLGVATIEEGIQLRKNNIKCEILILGTMFPLENLAVAAKYKLMPTISSFQALHELYNVAIKSGTNLGFHLGVDTGMGRIGVSVNTAKKMLEEIALCKNISMKGIYTHFSVAGTDRNYTHKQIARYKIVINYAKKLGLKFSAHTANSSAIIREKEAHFDMVRPGLMLYGMYPFHGARKKISLLPVLTWKTKIAFLKKVPANTSISYSRTYITKRPTLVATLPVGYADGYLRKFSNKADVLIKGQRCRVIGRVTMDMIMVDVTKIPGAAIGDEVVLLGRQGADKVRAEELANLAGTINYEITCGISYRVPRILI